MKIAVINETSAADRNTDILEALDGRGHELLNCGMKKNGSEPQLTYLQTGFLGGLLLSMGRVEFVVGGCGTGQGFLNAVVQYPGVVCGHIVTPLDAWLFTRINGGNCVSLMLNQAYGWGSEVNLRLIFDQLFSPERGGGFPEHRKDSQRKSAQFLSDVGRTTHHAMVYIVRNLSEKIIGPALDYPGIQEILFSTTSLDAELEAALRSRLHGGR